MNKENNEEVIELTPEMLEALGGATVGQAFNYTFADSFEIEDIEDRRLYINNEITDDDVTSIGYHILRYNRLDKGIAKEDRVPVILYINTNGGSLYSGNSLISIVENSITPVYTVNLGRCFSMGLLVFLAGHKRYTLDNGVFLLHDGCNGDYNSNGKYFDKAEFEKNVLEVKLKDYILDKTSIKSKTYEQNYRKEWYMDANLAKELNICEYIVGEDCTIDEIL